MNNERGRSSFVMYTRYREPLNLLGGEDVKRLMNAVFDYVEDGEVSDFGNNGGLKMAFAVIRADLDRDGAKWAEAKARQSEAGRAGAEKRWGKPPTAL